jgi:hypothetical protein
MIPSLVIPGPPQAEPGIHFSFFHTFKIKMDSRFRGNDGVGE